ncbi:hypothetical protein MMPV_005459 [Pyropia vietnamensis]
MSGVAAAAAVMLITEWRIRGLVANTAAAAAAHLIHTKAGGLATITAGTAADVSSAPGCATLRQSLLYYNRAPKTGSTSLRQALYDLARRCGLAIGACHKHSGPNTDAVVALGAVSLRCGSVFACHIRDTPAVRAVVDRAARKCSGGAIRLTSVRPFAAREASQILEWTGLNASAAVEGLPDTAIAARLDLRGDYLATYFGLRPTPVASPAARYAIAADATTAAAPLTEDTVATALSWYDAVVDVTLDGGEPAAAILSALLGEPLTVPHRNKRAGGAGSAAAAAWAARIGAVRAAASVQGRGIAATGPLPDEVLYTVGLRIHRHLAHFLIGKDNFDDEKEQFRYEVGIDVGEKGIGGKGGGREPGGGDGSTADGTDDDTSKATSTSSPSRSPSPPPPPPSPPNRAPATAARR